MHIVGSAQIMQDLCAEIGPAAYLDQAQDGDNCGSDPDKDELEYLVENGRAKSTECNIQSDGNR